MREAYVVVGMDKRISWRPNTSKEARTADRLGLDYHHDLHGQGIIGADRQSPVTNLLS